MTLEIHCIDCLKYNRQHLGEKGFEFKENRFTTFTDAFKHQTENPTHYMEFIVYTESEDE